MDLSNLLYSDGTMFSKMNYFFFLSSSILNMGLELTKILTWGNNPIVIRLMSLTFLKIFVFILTKLYINVYILSVIVKSMMYQFVVKDQMIVAGIPELEELFSFYYRGVDRPASVLTFDQATLYIPLVITAICEG